MSEPKRQHPVVIFTGILKELKSYLFPLVLVLVFQIRDTESFFGDGIFLYILIGSLVLSGVIGFLRWFFFRFSFQEGALFIQSGVFIKKQRTIKPERIQTVSLRAGLLLRAMGLVTLHIETAGGKVEPELDIQAVTKQVAMTLKNALEQKKDVDEDSVKEKVQVQKQTVEPIQLLIAGITSGGVGVLFSFLLVIGANVVAVLPSEYLTSFFDRFVATGVVVISILVFLLFFASWMVSAIRFFIEYAFFTIQRKENELQITRGLIVKKQLNLKLHRIQSISMIEGLLRQPFGYVSLQVEVAGGSSKEDGYRTLIHPLIKKNQVMSFLDFALPGNHNEKPIEQVPKRAKIRYIIRGTLPVILGAIPLTIWVPYGWLLFLLVIPAFLWAILQYKDAGHVIDEHLLVLRYRNIARFTVITPKTHIQNMTFSTNFLQRRRKVTTLSKTVLSTPTSKTFLVKDIGDEQKNQLWHWYSRNPSTD